MAHDCLTNTESKKTGAFWNKLFIAIVVAVLLIVIFMLISSLNGLGPGNVPAYGYDQTVQFENKSLGLLWIAVEGDVQFATVNMETVLIGPDKSKWIPIKSQEEVVISGKVSDAYGLSRNDPVVFYVAIDSDTGPSVKHAAAVRLGEGRFRVKLRLDDSGLPHAEFERSPL